MSLPIRERTIYKQGGFDIDTLEKIFQSTLGAGVRNPKPAEA